MERKEATQEEMEDLIIEKFDWYCNQKQKDQAYDNIFESGTYMHNFQAALDTLIEGRYIEYYGNRNDYLKKGINFSRYIPYLDRPVENLAFTPIIQSVITTPNINESPMSIVTTKTGFWSKWYMIYIIWPLIVGIILVFAAHFLK